MSSVMPFVSLLCVLAFRYCDVMVVWMCLRFAVHSSGVISGSVLMMSVRSLL